MAGTSVPAQEPKLTVIPQPQEATFFDESFTLSPTTHLAVEVATIDGASFVVDYLRNRVERATGLTLGMNPETPGEINNAIYLGDLRNPALPSTISSDLDLDRLTKIGRQGYYLQIQDSLVAILANSATGLFNGTQTLLQLLEAAPNGVELFGVTIYDWPDYDFRATHGNFVTAPLPNLDYAKELIEFMSRYKLNAFLLDVTNRLEFRRHPKIGSSHGRLSAEEVRELVSFAARYRIEIVPMTQTLSNLHGILSLPDYIGLAEFPGAHTLAPLAEETYEFIEEIIAEIAPLFDSPLLHIGGGGTDHIGWSRSKPDVDRLGRVKVLAEHYKRVISIVRKYEKHPMISGELVMQHPLLLTLLGDDLTYLTPWSNSDRDSPIVEALLGDGHFVAPTLKSQGGLFPHYDSSIPGMQSAAVSGAGYGSPGAVLVSSQERGFNFLEFDKYAWALWAELSWSAQPLDIETFQASLLPTLVGGPGLDSEVLFGLLTDLGHLVTWSTLWKHPFFLIDSGANDGGNDYALRLKSNQVSRLLDQIIAQAGRTKQTDYMRLLGTHAHMAQRLSHLSQSLADFRSSPADAMTNGSSGDLVDECIRLIDDLNVARDQLQILWIRDYRAEDLPGMLDLYGLQIENLRNLIDDVSTARIVGTPGLQSQHIYHPNREGLESTNHAFFRKTFEISPGVKSAHLQVLPESHAKIYVNGAFIDEVILAESQDGKSRPVTPISWDITPVVQPGKNVIAVEVWNYRPEGAAGVNVVAFIEYELGRAQEIHSDGYWKVSLKEEPDWRNLGFFDVQWLNSDPHNSDVILIKPNFETSRQLMLKEDE